jgi:HEAT repeat protein
MSTEILKKLAGGDPDATFPVVIVSEEVEANPALLDDIFKGTISPDPLVKMRSTQVIGRVAWHHPDYLIPYNARLIEVLSKAKERQYRRNLIRLFPRLHLTVPEKERANEILRSFLKDKNVTVIIAAFEAMIELAGDDPAKQVKLLPMLDEMTRTGSPAVRVRARKAQEKLFQSLTAEE